MKIKEVLLVLTDRWADWEAAYAISDIRMSGLYEVKTIALDRTPKESIANGFAMVTEERRATGIFGILSIRENTVIASLKRCVKFRLYLSEKAMAEKTAWSVKALSIKTPSQTTKIRSLSGGNQQKVIFGRWMLTNPDILLLDEPTRGIDVGARAAIYELIAELARAGMAVVVVSSDLDEMLALVRPLFPWRPLAQAPCAWQGRAPPRYRWHPHRPAT